MERSSPLAAMQPQSLPFGHAHWPHAIDTSTGSLGGGCRAGAFDFKDLSMKNNPSDYFDMKPHRSASPTASLAVDLSRNFHIDRSPQPPTPRRSLFSSNLICDVDYFNAPLTTPIPQSSPCTLEEPMEISPLPHKVPFSTTIEVQSPTPQPSPLNDSMQSSPSIIPESPCVSLKPPPINERRRLTLTRPCLSRIKGLTTSAVPTRSAGFDAPPPFRFATLARLPASTSAALEEPFIESPESTTFQSPLRSPVGLPRPKSSHQKPSVSSTTQTTGSPVPCQAKKNTLPLQRPRKQFRRSLSMFEHPTDVLNQQQQDQKAECGLQSIMDLDEAPQLQLPHFFPEQDTIPRITKEAMIDVLDGKYSHCYDESMVIDCRFEYEYNGGHINGAINFNNKEELARKLFDHSCLGRTLLIFHCEYSAHRAPIAARYIRAEDRATNAHQYPKLTYPEIYILDGGYSAFFKDHKCRCFPQNYVEMNDKEHTSACERGLGRIRQQRAKLGRAQTFAFGQHQMVDESPTGPAKQCASSLMRSLDILMDVCVDESPVMKRGNARRMASF